MPNDEKTETQLEPNAANEADLKSDALDTSPLPGPIPSIEQEPQTSALQTNTTPQSSATDVASPAGSFQNTQTVSGGGSNRNKKKLLIGGIIAGILVLLVGSGAFAYFVYQSPDKVVADSFINLFGSQPRTAKTSISAENDDAKMNLTIDVKSNDKMTSGALNANVTMKQQNIDFNGSVDFTATVDCNGYIKLNDVDKLADKLVNTMIDAQVEQYKSFGMKIDDADIKAQKEKMLAQFKPVIEKINNRWIKFDTKADNSVSKQQKCLTDAVKKLQSNNAMRSEFAKAYSENKFINVKEQLGMKDGSYGYVLGFDTTKAEGFGKAAEKTSFIKELQKCDGFEPSTSTSTTPADDSVENMRIELWVTQWSHQITKLKIEGTDTSSSMSNSTKVMFDISLGYDKVEGLVAPSDAIDFKDLEKEFQQLNPVGAGAATSSTISI